MLRTRAFLLLPAVALLLAAFHVEAADAPVDLPTTPTTAAGTAGTPLRLREATRLSDPGAAAGGEAAAEDLGPDRPSPEASPEAAPEALPGAAPTDAALPAAADRRFQVRGEEWTLISAARGLTLHKPIYIFPVSWSPDFEGEKSEFIFQFSAKHRLFGVNLFFGYTQKSFWQVYNGDDSRPFRETNFNPEIFYRWQPGWGLAPTLGFDFGAEHESNGRSRPRSRSWNRLYASAFLTRGRTLAYLKTWWRVPERDRRGPDDSGGDDNPDITRFLGYNELHVARQLGRQQQLALMLRGNPATAKGSLQLSWTMPNRKSTIFYALRLFHGHGESLIDFDRRITRLSIGVMLAR